jgi:hypothetical protein
MDGADKDIEQGGKAIKDEAREQKRVLALIASPNKNNQVW